MGCKWWQLQHPRYIDKSEEQKEGKHEPKPSTAKKLKTLKREENKKQRNQKENKREQVKETNSKKVFESIR